MIGTEISFNPTAVENHSASSICVCSHRALIFMHLCERNWVEKTEEDKNIYKKGIYLLQENQFEKTTPEKYSLNT